MNEFMARNALRQQQIDYVRQGKWAMAVADRVQLSAEYETHVAWTSGTIIDIRATPRQSGDLQPQARRMVVVQLDNGDIIQSDHPIPLFALPLVPHEDYFKDEAQP